MEKIALEAFLEKVMADPALRAQLDPDANPEAVLGALRRMAADMGFELELPAASGIQALDDDALAPVSGGVNTALPLSEGELNPYSWFVTIMRRLTGQEERRPAVPEIPVPGLNNR